MERAIVAAGSLVSITPSDSAKISELNTPCSLFIGTGGDLVVQGVNDSTSVTLKNVPDGSFLPILVTQVYATGTTATDIVGLR